MENTFYQNEIINNINVTNQVAQMLSNFDDTYIMHIIDDCIKMRFRPFQPPMPNIVLAYENTFKSVIASVPSYSEQVMEVRKSTYLNIIQYICDVYNLQFQIPNDETFDYFTITNLLYELLVSNFENNLVSIFINFILKEKKSLYDYLTSNQDIQIRNSSSSYNKKIYKNNKLAIIQANINVIVDMIAGSDINFETMVNLIIPDKNISKYILLFVTDKGDIFKNHFAIYLADPFSKPDLITEIKLKLHEVSVDASKTNIPM